MSNTSKDDVFLGVMILAVIVSSIAAFFIALIPAHVLGLNEYPLKPAPDVAVSTAHKPSVKPSEPRRATKNPQPRKSAHPKPGHRTKPAGHNANPAPASTSKPVAQPQPSKTPTPRPPVVSVPPIKVPFPTVSLPPIVIKLPPLLPILPSVSLGIHG